MPDTRSPAVPDDLVELGRVVSAYGVKGWVKIQPYSADAGVLLNAASWWLKAPGSLARPGALSHPSSVVVLACRPQGASVVANLQGVDDRTQAESLKGCGVWVPRAVFPSSDPDEYYWVDLIGCRLWGERDSVPELLGNVVEVLDNGAHAVLRVARMRPGPDGEPAALEDSRGRALETLVPFVAAHVHHVDLAARRIDSDWPVDD
ncbi:MAG TPA: ribosome maturation factor RimM [Burkholderiaceae bacterium]|nr:ribosome maturation factor RimM [Burkholderiaceae bacterium]